MIWGASVTFDGTRLLLIWAEQRGFFRSTLFVRKAVHPNLVLWVRDSRWSFKAHDQMQLPRWVLVAEFAFDPQIQPVVDVSVAEDWQQRHTR
jgi:hypothetical protein